MNRSGFSLVELLVVVAILGILATLGLPRLNTMRERAVVASMISDLRNLASAQVAFYSTYQDFANGVAPQEVPGPGGRGRVALTPSPGNVIVVRRRGPNNANGEGWSATATNPAVTNPAYNVCGVFMGAARYAPNRAVTATGVPACY
ncbi:MAG: type II secretion system protein [Gemmatimonadota bacterium]|nr:type II secretion system protein [Gemmatimonadota bacterium]